jgi:hypothetical protein
MSMQSMGLLLSLFPVCICVKVQQMAVSEVAALPADVPLGMLNLTIQPPQKPLAAPDMDQLLQEQEVEQQQQRKKAPPRGACSNHLTCASKADVGVTEEVQLQEAVAAVEVGKGGGGVLEEQQQGEEHEEDDEEVEHEEGLEVATGNGADCKVSAAGAAEDVNEDATGDDDQKGKPAGGRKGKGGKQPGSSKKARRSARLRKDQQASNAAS